MNGSILTIGDELLIGQVVNTNQAYIAQRLNDAGVAVARMVTVGDSMPAIIEAFRELWQAYDIVVVTGGLGPTHDDITKHSRLHLLRFAPREKGRAPCADQGAA